MKKIKWCIIGAGGIADRRTIPAILSDSNNEIVALMDKNEDVAKKLGIKYNCKSYSDEEEMLKENDSDAVYIGTPVMCHVKQALLALKYDRNVFMEKPISATYKEAKELVDEFKKKNKQITIGYMMKYHNLNIKAKEMVKEDKIGQVVDVRAQFSCWYPDIKGAWRQNKALGGGGAFMDLGVHCLEIIEYILDDEIVDVKSFYSTNTFSYEVEDQAVVIFKTRKGTLGHIDVNFNIPDDASEAKLEIYGTKGYIINRGTLAQEEVGELKYVYAPQGDYSASQNRVLKEPEIYFGEKGNLYLKQIQDFNRIITSGINDYYYADKAVHVQEIVDKVYNN